MEKVKAALLYLGIALIVFGGMAALPGQELFVAVVIGIGVISIISAGLVEYMEDRRA